MEEWLCKYIYVCVCVCVCVDFHRSISAVGWSSLELYWRVVFKRTMSFVWVAEDCRKFLERVYNDASFWVFYFALNWSSLSLIVNSWHIVVSNVVVREDYICSGQISGSHIVWSVCRPVTARWRLSLWIDEEEKWPIVKIYRNRFPLYVCLCVYVSVPLFLCLIAHQPSRVNECQSHSCRSIKVILFNP